MRNIVLVTGGAGYIGAHVCKALATQGYVPVVFDDFSSGHREAVRWGVVVEGDIRDAAAVDRTFRMFRPDSVVHLAGR
ncbi:MAG: NAD-dependent epimerase/dehydratase family protein, partial [Alphaproteobacteria bacterium]